MILPLSYNLNHNPKLIGVYVLNEKNANIALQMFNKLLMDVINLVAPLKTVRIKQTSEPWFSSDILYLISLRDKAWVKFRKFGKSELYNEYKKLRNRTQYVIKKAKVSYIKDKMSECKDSKSLWKTLKSLGTTSKCNASPMNIGLKTDSGDVSFDRMYVANTFNQYFCTIATKLVELLPNRIFDVQKLNVFYERKNVQSSSFHFTVVNDYDVEKLLRSLSVCKSTGCDAIPAKFLKDGAVPLSCPLTYVISLSLTTSKVPIDFKTAL